MTREEASKWLSNLKTDIGKTQHQELWHYKQVIDEITKVLEQEPKTGKWVSETRCHKSEDGHEYMYIVEHCSECGARRHIGWQDVNYCPNCGVKMEV